MWPTTTPNRERFGTRGKGKGGFGPLFAAPFGALVYIAVNKWWRGRLPPAAPCGGRGLGWRAPPPAQFNPPASPPPTAGRACAPPCGGRRLASRGGGADSMGGRCRRRSSVVGGAPLSCVCRAPCVCGGGGVAVARGAAGPFTSMHSKPPRAPRPRRCPCAPAGAGLGFRWLRPAGTARPLSRAGKMASSYHISPRVSI